MLKQLKTIREFVESVHEGEWLSYVDRAETLTAITQLEAMVGKQSSVPEGYALVGIDALKALGVYDLVSDACRYPVVKQPQAEAVPSDVVRDAERWRTFLATRPANTHAVINDAIDAAMAKGEKS